MMDGAGWSVILVNISLGNLVEGVKKMGNHSIKMEVWMRIRSTNFIVEIKLKMKISFENNEDDIL
jgi:hypothetical protein